MNSALKLITSVCVYLFSLTKAQNLPCENLTPGYDWPCPEANSILPCTCSYDLACNINIDCSNVDSDEELSAAFEVLFPFDNVDSFVINNDGMTNNIVSLSQGIFGNKCFDFVTIEGTTLKSIADNVFMNSQESLNYFNLANNQIDLFIFEALLEYQKLISVDLSNNAITNLPALESGTLLTLNLNNNRNLQLRDGAATFMGVPNLEVLKLSGTNLSIINQHLFATNQMLMELDLSSNGITLLDADAINPPSQLSTLNLDNNGLQTVLPGAISGLASDCQLSLANNEIDQLFEDAWKPIFTAITEGVINLEGNPLLCGCDMDWIIYNDDYWNTISDGTTCLGGNNIHELDVGFFTQNC